jgi:hypothetical protein
MSQMMKQRMVLRPGDSIHASRMQLGGPRSSFNPDTGHSAATWVPAAIRPPR